ncbi:MAG: hypothetical protein V2I41_02150 [Pseudomonadales bacterium]|nr:hypothetical protein [Pseudomonadales bacterium]
MQTNSSQRSNRDRSNSHAIAVAKQQELRPQVAGALVAVLTIWLTAAAAISAIVAS